MLLRKRKAPRGRLVLIGGNVDKSRKKIVLRKMVDKADAERAVIIPTASSERPVRLGREYQRILRGLGVPHCEVLEIVRRSDVDREQDLKAMDRADLIFFTGGDQVKLVRVFERTKLLAKVRRRFYAGATIAGTSAGAHVAGETMIFDGNRYGFCKGTVGVDAGLGFLPGVTVDTHFWTRRRLARLSQLMAKGHSDLGLGLAENTAVVVDPDRNFEVVGTGMVTLLSNERMGYTDYDQVARNQPVTTEGLTLTFLAPGAIYNLEKRAVVRSGQIQVTNNPP